MSSTAKWIMGGLACVVMIGAAVSSGGTSVPHAPPTKVAPTNSPPPEPALPITQEKLVEELKLALPKELAAGDLEVMSYETRMVSLTYNVKAENPLSPNVVRRIGDAITRTTVATLARHHWSFIENVSSVRVHLYQADRSVVPGEVRFFGRGTSDYNPVTNKFEFEAP